VAEELTQRIRRLVDGMNKLELEIASATDAIKECYVNASTAMPEDKSYFLSGVQTASVVKSYLLTRRGIDIPGEGTMEIPEFIESVLRFANCPKRKIEVLSDLSTHLENIYAMIQREDTQ
jgi:hypothetical protein